MPSPTIKRSPTRSVSVSWFGHSAFSIASKSGKSILIDPWMDNPQAPPGSADRVTPDIILISHGHSDHFGNVLEISRRTSATVVCIHELSIFIRNKGIETVRGMNKGGTMDVDGVKITMVDARHSADIDFEREVVPGGEAAGFVVAFDDGFTLYHAGDTALFGDMKFIGELYRPDLVFLPIGGLYTMGPREAAVACRLLNPKVIVGMHYGTFPALTGTPKELRKYLPQFMKRKVLDMEIGKPREI